jgi:DNA (cytosine-5)-methyltransferase 1
MINGLDLFSGIGGIALALAPWVRPVAYCEIDRYAQGVLVSRQADGMLPMAGIWDDVRTLRGDMLPIPIDIITGGFPCQDISVAGTGAGLAGERSGLFWEIARLTGELRPAFVFLENVPAITTRGGREVVGAFATLGYDCRWCVISAASVGANHRRERWFLLAHAYGQGLAIPKQQDQPSKEKQELPTWPAASKLHWITAASDLVREVHGLPHRVDRIKALGNAVVPLQARTAFQILSGLKVI